MSEKQEPVDGIENLWYAEAKTVTQETLPAFFEKVVNGHKHDYNTIVYAMTACMLAAMSAVNKSDQGGITGFQADCCMWRVMEVAFNVHGPCRLLRYENALFPQYESHFEKTISKSAWEWVQQIAKTNLETGKNDGTVVNWHPDVKRHMHRVAMGIVPFGLKVVE